MMDVWHVCTRCGQDLAAIVNVPGLRRRMAYIRCFAAMQLHLKECGAGSTVRA